MLGVPPQTASRTANVNLQPYFDRIGFEGPAKADVATFRRLHCAHAETLTFENFDVQFGVPVSREPRAIFDKIVTRRRGGWCYEMNGLFAAALEEIGFEVTRLAGAVAREEIGDAAIGNHLVNLVRIDGEEWIADVGFGDGLVEPARLREGPAAHPIGCSLRRLEGGWWRFSGDARSGGPGYDFNPAVSDPALLDARCAFLQTDPSSPFVQNAVAQRWRDGRHFSLRGRVLRALGPDTEEKSLVGSAREFVRTLRELFDLDLPEAGDLWPQILRRHEAVFAGRDPLA